MVIKNIKPQFIYLLSVIIICLSLTVNAQWKDIKFRHLSTEDGMAQNGGYCITQDNNGFILIGTEAGLNKYDGYNFTIYDFDVKDSNSLSNNTILSIYKDHEGTVWVGTENGLNKFNSEKEYFTRYLNDPDDPNSISHSRIYSICEDNDGCIWVGTENGLNKFDQQENRFIHYYHYPDNPKSLSHNHVRSLFKSKSGFLWIGTYGGGLNRLDHKKEQFTCYQNVPDEPTSLSNNYVLSVYEDKAGVLWVGTDRAGLNKFNREKEIFIRYRNIADDPNSISDNQINVIYEDKTGVLWIGTGIGGLNVLNREEGKFFRYQNRQDDPYSLSFDRVLSIFEDNNGGLWFGTRGGGVNIYYRETHKFTHYKPDPDNPHSLSNKMIWKIIEDREGIIWIGTDNGGLNKFDRKKNVFKHYLHDPENPNSLSYDRVLEICEDPSGILWLGTNGGGLNKFDPKTERFTHYKHDPDDSNSLCDNRIIALWMDHLGILWIGTRGGGFNTFDPKTEQFTFYKHDPNDTNSLSNDRVYFFHEDRKSYLWVGTFSGLNKFDRRTKKFTRFMSDPSDPHSISDNMIYSFCEDKTGTMWFGGGNSGLNRYNSSDNTFTHYTKKDGLIDNVIYTMLADDNGNLWISTNRGLSCFNPKTVECKNYDIKDGLQSNEFNTLAALKSRSGELFFGGVNGFNIFHPDSLKENPYIPPVKITTFQIFNKTVPIGKMPDGRTILEKSITETDEVVLSYKDNVFSFEFVALHFISPDKNQYAYMMVGLEEDWNYVGTRRFVSYTGISPGKYTFRVKGSNNDGVWNEEGTSLRIKIIPPYWRTWWFYTLCAILIIALLAAIFIYQINRIKKQKEKEVQRKAMETYSHVFEQGTAAVYRRNIDSETYEYMGEGIKDITGYSANEFSLPFWKKIIIEIDMGGRFTSLSLDEVHDRFRKGEIDRLVMDMKIRTKSDETRWIRDMTTALFDESGVCYACFGIFFDITDRKLVEDELRVKKEVMEKDLDMAREVQMALLSQNYPKSFPENVPEGQGALYFSHRYIPTATLAGDFFEILPISNHQVGIMIYDVMGHGVRASLLTAYLHGLVEELMPIAADPVTFIKRLNTGLGAIMAQFLTGMFATAFYLVADIKKGKIYYTNAGHPKPYMLKRNNGDIERLEQDKRQQEPALGLFEKFNYTVTERVMNNDDIILFFTDGLYEVENTDSQMFGEKKLINVVKDNLNTSPEQMLDAILYEINKFAGTTEFIDDVCMVTMHVKSASI